MIIHMRMYTWTIYQEAIAWLHFWIGGEVFKETVQLDMYTSVAVRAVPGADILHVQNRGCWWSLCVIFQLGSQLLHMQVWIGLVESRVHCVQVLYEIFHACELGMHMWTWGVFDEPEDSTPLQVGASTLYTHMCNFSVLICRISSNSCHFSPMSTDEGLGSA